MNPVIKQLAEEAGFCLWEDEHWNPGDVVDWGSRYDRELVKFHDLIVADAIRVVQRRFMGDLNREDQEVQRCVKIGRAHV